MDAMFLINLQLMNQVIPQMKFLHTVHQSSGSTHLAKYTLHPNKKILF